MDGRSDNLTFIFGFLLFVLLLFTVYGFFRHRAARCKFPACTCGGAVVVLLVATAHWWPFVIFLTAVACAAAAQTVRVSSSPGVNSQIAALALGTSIIGAVRVLCQCGPCVRFGSLITRSAFTPYLCTCSPLRAYFVGSVLQGF